MLLLLSYATALLDLLPQDIPEVLLPGASVAIASLLVVVAVVGVLLLVVVVSSTNSTLYCEVVLLVVQVLADGHHPGLFTPTNTPPAHYSASNKNPAAY